jgi:hypothetical protein
MMFDAKGNLIETDDGGIYKRTNPRSNAGDWLSINGDIQTTELHDIAYDTFADIVIGGTQDTGFPMQAVPLETTWFELLQGDGGDAAVEVTSTPGLSVRYSSNQNLRNFIRSYWDADNNLVGYTFPPLLLVGGGSPLVRSFITPFAVNSVDPNRLVISGGNSVYESYDQGDTIREVGPGVAPTGSGVDPLAYGAADNPDIIYVGSGDRVLIRTAAWPAPFVNSLSFPGRGTGVIVTDVVIDPSDAETAIVSNQLGVFRTTDAGATWTTVTGNLQSLTPSTIRSLAYAATPMGDAVIAGTQNGIYFATEATGFTVWKRLGNGLPTVPVFDLTYDRDDDVLIAGTMGRGAWRLPAISVATLSGGL